MVCNYLVYLFLFLKRGVPNHSRVQMWERHQRMLKGGGGLLLYDQLSSHFIYDI